MSLYDMQSLIVASNEVTDENMFDMFREIQLFAMAIIQASEIDDVIFDSRTIREDIPAGMQTRITPYIVQVDTVDEDNNPVTIDMYEYEYSLEIKEIGI